MPRTRGVRYALSMPSRPEPIAADLTGRICIVTGATAGIGKEIARNLARLRGDVILACRDGERAEQARREIAGDTGNVRVSVALLDVSSRASLHAFARGISRADILVNNAGAWFPDRRLSVDGVELTWATNVLGPHLLTILLGGALRESRGARVINVASQLAGGLDFDDLESVRRYDGVAAYKQSKQALRMLSWASADRFAGSPVSVNAVHPGLVSTKIADRGAGLRGALYRALFRHLGVTPQQGADTATWLAASSDARGVTGRYWSDRRERECPFRDPQEIERLWTVVCRRNGIEG